MKPSPGSARVLTAFALIGPLLAGCAAGVQPLPGRNNLQGYGALVGSCRVPGPSPLDSISYMSDIVERPFPRPPWGWRPAVWFAQPPRGKLHPELRRRLRLAPLLVRDTLLVTLRETLTIPEFPSLNEQRPRTDPYNQARLAAMRALIDSLAAERDSSYAADSLDLLTLSGTVLHRHWLTHSLLIELPLTNVLDLASRPHVVYIQPRMAAEAPPSCPPTSSPPNDAIAANDPREARLLLQTDSFRNLGLSYGHVSLLDTGVWTGHRLLNGVTFGVAGDCVNGDLTCMPSSTPGFSTTDVCAATGGHGTASAASLVGNSALGDRWRGGTDAVLDHFKVFAPGPCGGCGVCLDADAACHGFENALANGDRVIVAEMSSLASDWAAVGMSAQNAFAAGAVVVAANGNQGPTPQTVTSPASAPCVIGVGSRSLQALQSTDPVQSVGPAWGDRFKPDIQAPSGIETARTMEAGCARTDLLRMQLGTSGATPWAGTAAVMLRNWLKAGNLGVSPGQVNAALILAGRRHGTLLNHTEGAGPLELPTNGCAWWGWTVLNTGQAWQVPLDLTLIQADTLEVSLWWPEPLEVDASGNPVSKHSNIDLRIYDPGGSVVANSLQGPSVFERATAPVAGKLGKWFLDLRAMEFYDPTRQQVVFWMAAARRKP